VTERDDVFELLRRVTLLVLVWSYEGTFRSEEVVKRVAHVYGTEAEVTVGADWAVLTVGERTASFSRAPTVPPLDQVSAAKELFSEI
jgi:hypothetical protein